ncbi:MAG: hypothetical protein MI974_11905 [Chitinophagales bacterium]|nr:hypothetical protein [Chitinophagales bacterium]
MKQLILCCYLLCCTATLVAQEAQEGQNYVRHWEVYGLKIHIAEKLITKRMKCGLGFLKEKKGTLYRIEIESLLYTRDSTVYLNNKLKDIKYIVFPSSIELKISQEYYVLAGNSSVTDYIVGFRAFEKNEIQTMDNITQHAFFQGMEQCYQLNIIDRIKLLLGIDRRKVYTKERNEEKKNKFYKFILNSK